LILKVGSTAGFAMIFALLTAAIIWNLGTWYLGLPSSSSHTLIGSIMGVGLANQFMEAKGGASGVDWAQAMNIGKTLLISPLIGFVCAALLLVLAKRLLSNRELYSAPEGNAPPPFWIRTLLILTCTGVSFAHGSNDGQKGMGLIMLILIGTVPTAYALNRSVSVQQTQDFAAVSQLTSNILTEHAGDSNQAPRLDDPRRIVTDYVRTHVFTSSTIPAVRQMVDDTRTSLVGYRELSRVPAADVSNVRNDMYVVSEALRYAETSGQLALSEPDMAMLHNYRRHIDGATKFIPGWVKVAVALALGLGTMIGWKRIVVTVGEKIGKEHLSYGQGAAAEITAMATIGAADAFGMPVSTTHVLSSAVAGTMTANGSGLQWGTVQRLLMAWVMTLPASILLAGSLFYVFRSLAG
jgi:PiT family inorganic phosphate transporter